MKCQAVFAFSLSLLLVACQTQTPLTSSQNPSTSGEMLRLQGQQRQRMMPLSPQTPVGKVLIIPAAKAGKARVSVEITMPKADADFSTQALAVNTTAKVRAELRGLGIVTPLYADNADENGFVTNPGGTFTLTFSDVPYGSARRLVLGAYDSSDTLIPGATVSTGFHLNSATTPVELSFRTSLLGDILDFIATFAGGEGGQPTTGSLASDHHLLSTLDLGALQSFLDTLTGVSGSAPNYAYTTHPSLILNVKIANDLVNNNGSVAALETLYTGEPSRYVRGAGSVSFTLEGLINPDTATVVVRDPASGQVVGKANGSDTITGVTPGIWKVEATAPGYTASSSPMVTVIASQIANAGTLSFSVSDNPAITVLSANSGVIGSSLTISGSNFHTSVAGNTVTFGNTVATVTSASPTELVVTVPAAISGAQNVRVTVGGNISNTQDFNVTPVISSLSTSSGAVGSSVTLAGTGFSSTKAENTVRLNGVTATITSASATQLVVSVPQAGNGNFTVQVGNQTSAGVVFNVLPTVTLSVPASPISATVALTATVSSGNPISKVQFYDGSTLLGEVTAAPYTYNWDTTTAISGSRNLTAKVIDTQNNEAISTAVDRNVNQPPVISALTASLNPIVGLSHPTLLTCSFSDADDTNPTVTWDVVGESAGVFLDNGGGGGGSGSCPPEQTCTPPEGNQGTSGDSTNIWTAPAVPGGPYELRCSISDGVNPPVTQTIWVQVQHGMGTVTGNGGLF